MNELNDPINYDLKDGRVGCDEGKGGLDATGGVDGSGGLDEAALQGVDVSSGGLLNLRRIRDLLGAPLTATAPAHECEHSHFCITLLFSSLLFSFSEE